MDLASALKAGGSLPASASQPKAVVELKSLVKDHKRAVKILCHGKYKAGKTSFSTTLFEYLENKEVGPGLTPEQVLVVFLDCDDGFLPLVEKGAIPEKWWPAVKYEVFTNFRDLKAATVGDPKTGKKGWLSQLREHQAKHGVESAWLVVDNLRAEWEWARDDFCVDVYGKHENELLEQRRQEAIGAGKKTLPTYNQQFDYAAINAKHNAWAEAIKLSGVNFIWLSPTDAGIENRGEENERETTKPGGQKHNPGRVDYQIYCYKDAGGYYADLEESRIASKLFRRMPNPSILQLLQWVKNTKVTK